MNTINFWNPLTIFGIVLAASGLLIIIADTISKMRNEVRRYGDTPPQKDVAQQIGELIKEIAKAVRKAIRFLFDPKTPFNIKLGASLLILGIACLIIGVFLPLIPVLFNNNPTATPTAAGTALPISTP